MILGIVGSRKLKYQMVESYLRWALHEFKPKAICSGGAVGVDSFARALAFEQGIKYLECLPNYAKHGRFAPFYRNEKIINASDKVICLFDKEIRGGTKHSFRLAKKQGKLADFKIFNPKQASLFA